VQLKAHAKLNLSLRVFNKRPDGFHDIESVMQSISLHDLVTLSPIPAGIEVSCDDPNVPVGKDNLAYRAAEVFLSPVALGLRPLGPKAGHQSPVKGCRIHIEKRIPMAAGLAGGSADAAAVLLGLNNLTGDGRLATGDLIKLGAQIGSDVPFCLTGGTCLVEGKGERVTKQQPWPRTWFILVCPDLAVSARWAYEEFDRLHLNVPEQIKNDLEPAVVSKHGVITEIKERLSALGCREVQMSGSGPAVFGAVGHQPQAEEIFAKIREQYERSYLVESVEVGVVLQ
jgi:4-diphosphocytidyl-2-C-methyl-D-erythritol kinase